MATNTYDFIEAAGADIFYDASATDFFDNYNTNLASIDNILDGGTPFKLQASATMTWEKDSNNADLMTLTESSGQLAVPTTGSGAGLLLGGDTQLYRASANVLRTPDALTVDGTLTATGGAVLPTGSIDTGELATDAVTEKAVATGSTADPTTTSGTAAELDEMTITHTTIANEDVHVTFTGTFESTGVGDEVGFQFDRGGSKLGKEIIVHASVANYQVPISLSFIDIGPGTGSKVYAVHWRRVGGSGTVKSRGDRRYMTLTGFLK